MAKHRKISNVINVFYVIKPIYGAEKVTKFIEKNIGSTFG
jgi:hypothetical protein